MVVPEETKGTSIMKLSTLSLLVAVAAIPATALAQSGGGSSGGSSGGAGASSGTGGSGTSSGTMGGATSPGSSGSTLGTSGSNSLGTPNAAPSPAEQSQRYIPGNSNSQNSAGQLNSNNRSTTGSGTPGTPGSSTAPDSRTGQSPSDLTIMRDNPAQPNSPTSR